MNSPSSLKKAHNSHPRKFTNNTYVYPVISRRSGGVSLGINLNLDKNCNFDCPYCQVDRTVAGPDQKINLDKILMELDELLFQFDKKGVCQLETFSSIPDEKKVLQDIAISGDGEPTMVPEFEKICHALLERQKNISFPVKLVLITNATLLGKTSVHNGIRSLLSKQGAVWAKLDAGTEDWYQEVNVTKIRLEKIMENLLAAGKEFPLTLQTLFFKINGVGPSEDEINKYIERIHTLLKSGVKLPEIQLHTLARQPAQSFCSPLSSQELKSIQRKIIQSTKLTANTYL